MPPISGNPSTFVYWIRAGETEMVKIGFAQDPAQRLRDLQTAHYEVLHIIRQEPGTPAHERWLHRRYAHVRVMLEWYRLLPEMLTVDISAAIPAKSFEETALSRYLREREISIRAFAKQVGVSAASLCRIASGQSRSRPKTVEAIYHATDGIVGPAELHRDYRGWAA